MKSANKTALILGLLSATSLCQITGQVLPPQVAGRTNMAQPQPVSLAHLYWHFLIYQHHLDQLAAEHEKQGKDGAWLRSYLQTKLSMTDEEFQPIRESADRLDAAMSELNAKANAIAAAANAARSKEGAGSADEQQFRHKLKSLTAQREAAINKEIDTLNAALDPDAAQKLRDYLKNTFSKNVSIVHMTPDQLKNMPFGPTTKNSKVQP